MYKNIALTLYVETKNVIENVMDKENVHNLGSQ